MPHHLLRISLTAAVFFALAPSAHGGTFYVANNGLDGPSCGPKASPCRSIGQAVNTIAAAGDSIIVGPGSYGDLNGNGTLGDSPGEETGGFGCMVLVARGVTITSSDGAAATVIDARNVSADCNVGILADGTQFGKTGKGFTVTNTANVHGRGILINATNVKVRGNQVIGPGLPSSSFVGNGIDTVDSAQVILIEANQVIGWAYGIVTNGDGKTVSKNQVSLSNQTGITAHAGTIVGNITSGNLVGISAADTASASRNGVYGNALFGIWVFSLSFSGIIEGNNMVGNRGHGVYNSSASVLPAANNYWGAATGPGADPADDGAGGTHPTTATPFAKKPFRVKAPIKP